MGDELITQTKKLLMYPAFVGSIVLAVTMFLMIYLVPQMIGFIKSTGQEIPLQTRITRCRIFHHYWWVVLLAP
jgi:type IV pilus assembly protein PilC